MCWHRNLGTLQKERISHRSQVCSFHLEKYYAAGDEKPGTWIEVD